ncbi:MAG: F0F1 ATP synthase subunit B [Tepidisphaeraceae bacterium]|jgi:F-type H+-transporting ATPase subunit b
MRKRILPIVAAAGVVIGLSAPTWADAPKPELVPTQFSGQIVLEAVWVVVIFVIMLLILYPTAWKNVLAGLKAREERIRKDIADAEATRLKADDTLRQYNARLAEAEEKVRNILDQAAADAEKIATSVRMKAQQEAEVVKEQATKEIEAAKQTALNEIYVQTADLATSIAEKIVRRTLSPDDQRDLVNQSLEQFQNARRN